MWYTGQFYALFFLTITLKLDFLSAYTLIGISLLIGTPIFIFFGWLSDRIGRLKIIMAGCLIAAVTYFPLFGALTHYVNPDLEAFQAKTKITVTADPAQCNFHIFVGPWSKFTECDRAKDALTKSRPVVHLGEAAPAGSPVVDRDRRQEARRASTPRKADRQARRRPQGGRLLGRPPTRRRSTGSWPR